MTANSPTSSPRLQNKSSRWSALKEAVAENGRASKKGRKTVKHKTHVVVSSPTLDDNEDVARAHTAPNLQSMMRATTEKLSNSGRWQPGVLRRLMLREFRTILDAKRKSSPPDMKMTLRLIASIVLRGVKRILWQKRFIDALFERAQAKQDEWQRKSEDLAAEQIEIQRQLDEEEREGKKRRKQEEKQRQQEEVKQKQISKEKRDKEDALKGVDPAALTDNLDSLTKLLDQLRGNNANDPVNQSLCESLSGLQKKLAPMVDNLKNLQMKSEASLERVEFLTQTFTTGHLMSADMVCGLQDSVKHIIDLLQEVEAEREARGEEVYYSRRYRAATETMSTKILTGLQEMDEKVAEYEEPTVEEVIADIPLQEAELVRKKKLQKRMKTVASVLTATRPDSPQAKKKSRKEHEEWLKNMLKAAKQETQEEEDEEARKRAEEEEEARKRAEEEELERLRQEELAAEQREREAMEREEMEQKERAKREEEERKEREAKAYKEHVAKLRMMQEAEKRAAERAEREAREKEAAEAKEIADREAKEKKEREAMRKADRESKAREKAEGQAREKAEEKAAREARARAMKEAREKAAEEARVKAEMDAQARLQRKLDAEKIPTPEPVIEVPQVLEESSESEDEPVLTRTQCVPRRLGLNFHSSNFANYMKAQMVMELGEISRLPHGEEKDERSATHVTYQTMSSTMTKSFRLSDLSKSQQGGGAPPIRCDNRHDALLPSRAQWRETSPPTRSQTRCGAVREISPLSRYGMVRETSPPAMSQTRCGTWRETSPSQTRCGTWRETSPSQTRSGTWRETSPSQTRSGTWRESSPIRLPPQELPSRAQTRCGNWRERSPNRQQVQEMYDQPQERSQTMQAVSLPRPQSVLDEYSHTQQMNALRAPSRNDSSPSRRTCSKLLVVAPSVPLTHGLAELPLIPPQIMPVSPRDAPNTSRAPSRAGIAGACYYTLPEESVPTSARLPSPSRPPRFAATRLLPSGFQSSMEPASEPASPRQAAAMRFLNNGFQAPVDASCEAQWSTSSRPARMRLKTAPTPLPFRKSTRAPSDSNANSRLAWKEQHPQ